MFQGNLRELPPFGETLGMDWIETDTSEVCLRLCASDQVKLTAKSELFHPGAILATLDNACGWSIRQHASYVDGTSMATLNLRVDWLARASMAEPLLVTARCESYADDVAHVRGEAFFPSSRKKVAVVQATFMLGTPNTPREGSANELDRAGDHE